MPHLDEISRLIGALQATVSVGFREVHRRMDDRDRFTMEWRRDLASRVIRLERKSNGGNGRHKIPYAKISTVLGLIILGALSYMAPQAVRASIAQLLPIAIKALLTTG